MLQHGGGTGNVVEVETAESCIKFGDTRIIQQDRSGETHQQRFQLIIREITDDDMGIGFPAFKSLQQDQKPAVTGIIGKEQTFTVVPDQCPLDVIDQPGVEYGYRTAGTAEDQMDPPGNIAGWAQRTAEPGTFEVSQFFRLCQNSGQRVRMNFAALA